MGITLERENPSNTNLKEIISSKNFNFFIMELLNWYKKYGKQYIWRQNNNNYIKLIAEILLQKTTSKQVSKLMPFFLNKFPSFKALAATNINCIKSTILSLGLVSRKSLTLKQLSEKIVLRNPKKILEWEKILQETKGIGIYTINAFFINAFNLKKAAVDTNISRLLSRYSGVKFNRDARRDKRPWLIMEFIINKADAKNILFSMLDFCSEICTSKKPKCENCILKENCFFDKGGK